MKSILAAVLLALAPFAAAAATFEDGVSALSRADYAEAQRIFSQAADQGDAKSQFALAEMYRQGQGVHRDYAKAIALYRKAADAGLPGAEYNLGLLYQTGQGVPRNDQTAAKWYAKAAGQGYDDDPAGRLTHDTLGGAKEQFQTMMDRVFGAGRWRETSGYRTVAKENELRRQGAGTVPAGQRSHHSLGSPDAPGAYDAVVAGMSPQLAAAKLKRSREPLVRVVAEGVHGMQGPHLHIEPRIRRAAGPTAKSVGGDARNSRIATDARDRSIAASATLAAGDN